MPPTQIGRALRELGIGWQAAHWPQANGCVERFSRTLKEQLLWARHLETTGELTEALLEFRHRYNNQWLIVWLHFQSSQQTDPSGFASSRARRLTIMQSLFKKS
jgi:hypothetical protein